MEIRPTHTTRVPSVAAEPDTRYASGVFSHMEYLNINM